MGFKNLDYKKPLLLQAITHKSYHYENKAHSKGNNERLEFLGDAVLSLFISEELMKRYPEADEGVLSQWRASLVNTLTLYELASNLNLQDKVLLGKGERKADGHKNQRILASTLEALIGAYYLNYGLKKTKKEIISLFSHRLNQLRLDIQFEKDYKTRLQEILQKKNRSHLSYNLIKEEGPPHKKIFTVEILFEGTPLSQAKGKNKKEASQKAAQIALERWENNEVSL